MFTIPVASLRAPCLLTVDDRAARLTNSPAYSARALQTSLATVLRPHNRATTAVRLPNVVSQKCGRAAPWAAIFAVLATHEGCGTGEHRGQFDWRRDTYVPDPEKFWDEVKFVSANIDRDIGSGDTVSAREAALILQIDSNQFYKLRPSGAFDHCIREANRYDRALLQSFKSQHLYGLRLARRCGCQGMNGSIATRLYSLGVREAFPNAAMKIFHRRDVEAAIPHERHLLQT